MDNICDGFFKKKYEGTSVIAILGASGQLGSALLQLCQKTGRVARAFSREQIDLTHSEVLSERLTAVLGADVSVVVNASAYTQVDKAESPVEAQIAHQVNGLSPGVLARWCAERDIPLVHFSTDYVFPGTGQTAWVETDVTQPLNAYGRTKLEGEHQIAQAGGKYLIFRTSWVYDGYGKNFLKTMLRLAADRTELSVVSDQVGAPTYAPHLALGSLTALDHALKLPSFPSGIYHLCNRGETTWHGFANAIFDLARKNGQSLRIEKVNAILSDAYPTPAKRPLNSRLNTSQVERVFGVALPDWKVGVQECISDIYKGTSV